MQSGFQGFSPEAMAFFRGLARHNNRDWFQPRKPIFEQHIKQPMRELVESLNSAMKSFAPEYATDPDKAVYRIYRDTRFSKDKTPYKTHIAASFHRRGTGPHKYGGYYFEISHKEVGMGGGIYMPEPPVLLEIRRHISQHYAELRKILAARPVRELLGDVQGEQLSRVPKGFCSTDPAAGLLRFKSFFLYTAMPAEIATTPELFKELVRRFRVIKPFLDFLTAPQRKAPARLPDAW
jgi:uncharacterized protein (TIGR02453 family)